jgi:hypothetical protein
MHVVEDKKFEDSIITNYAKPTNNELGVTSALRHVHRSRKSLHLERNIFKHINQSEIDACLE